jgi:hypothetical protein
MMDLFVVSSVLFFCSIRREVRIDTHSIPVVKEHWSDIRWSSLNLRRKYNLSRLTLNDRGRKRAKCVYSPKLSLCNFVPSILPKPSKWGACVRRSLYIGDIMV